MASSNLDLFLPVLRSSPWAAIYSPSEWLGVHPQYELHIRLLHLRDYQVGGCEELDHWDHQPSRPAADHLLLCGVSPWSYSPRTGGPPDVLPSLSQDCSAASRASPLRNTLICESHVLGIGLCHSHPVPSSGGFFYPVTLPGLENDLDTCSNNRCIPCTGKDPYGPSPTPQKKTDPSLTFFHSPQPSLWSLRYRSPGRRH